MVTAEQSNDPNVDNNERRLLEYLARLTANQDSLLALLNQKRDAIAKSDLDQLRSLAGEEVLLQQQMADLQNERAQMIEEARQRGQQCDSLLDVARMHDGHRDGDLTQRVSESKEKMRHMQYEVLTNWVLEQSSLLHVSRMLEIIACGGRLQPTYGNGGDTHRRGALVDQEI